MANFLVTSASTSATGSDANDTFTLNTALAVSVQGAGGNDAVSAANSVASYQGSRYGLNEGNDTITLSGGGVSKDVSIYGGAGKDLVNLNGVSFTSTKLEMGGGNDVMELSAGILDGATIGGNEGNDKISATNAANVTSTIFNLGSGADTITFEAASVVETTTVQGGGGADTFSAGFAAGSAIVMLGDQVGTEFYGNDTIQVSAAGVGIEKGLIQGGGGADVISANTFLGDKATINGNFGKDLITITNAGTTDDSALVAGGAGGDTITFTTVASGVQNFVSVNGGGGSDSITFNVAAISTGNTLTAGFIQGGAGADVILIETTVMSGGGGGTAAGYIKYTSFADSNSTNMDTISAFDAAGAAASTGQFVVTQSVVDATTLTDDIGGKFTTTNGYISNAAWAGDETTITARAEYLDIVVANGSTVGLSDVNGTNYLFVKGSTGTTADLSDDLLVKIGNDIDTVAAAGNTAITVSLT
jgi:hypothetical protein